MIIKQNMHKSFLFFLPLLTYIFLQAEVLSASPDDSFPVDEFQTDTVIFHFVPDKKMFWADYRENRKSIEALSQLIKEHKEAIIAGKEKVRVLGFCSSYDTFKENLAVAKDRSNQVKSYYIITEGLKEEHFRTTNSTRSWKGQSDVIAVTYLIEKASSDAVEWNGDSVDESEIADNSEDAAGPVAEQKPAMSEKPIDEMKETAVLHDDADQVVEENVPVAEKPEQVTEKCETAAGNIAGKNHGWAIKTNVAYLVATVANIGVEYSFGEHYSIDVPFIFSPYRVSRNYTLKFMAVQPEFRYWLKTPMEGHFFGAHVSVGAFNLSVNSDMRYQSPDGFYGIGVSYGYMLPFAKRWAAEFTIGAGYVYTEYDSYYNIDNGAEYRHNVSYNYWGLTRVGAGLVYKFGK